MTRIEQCPKDTDLDEDFLLHFKSAKPVLKGSSMRRLEREGPAPDVQPLYLLVLCADCVASVVDFRADFG